MLHAYHSCKMAQDPLKKVSILRELFLSFFSCQVSDLKFLFCNQTMSLEVLCKCQCFLFTPSFIDIFSVGRFLRIHFVADFRYFPARESICQQSKICLAYDRNTGDQSSIDRTLRLNPLSTDFQSQLNPPLSFDVVFPFNPTAIQLSKFIFHSLCR